MKSVSLLLLLALLSAALTTAPASAVEIKIGSVAPDRSPWNDALNEIAREWQRISGGQVTLKIYPGGIAGSEEDMVRKMRLGTLGGAAVTNIGLAHIYREAQIFITPFLFENDDELNYVLQRLAPGFEGEIEAKGFKVIIWTMTGWVNFFTKGPVIYPEDLKKYKISFTSNNPESEQAWKKCGYTVIPNSMKDLLMALQSGMVSAFYLPPVMAGSGQYFALAPHMNSLRVAPLLGGIVLSAKVWDQIPESMRPQLVAAAPPIAEKLNKRIVELEVQTLKAMKDNGLVVHDPPADALARWRAVADKGMDELVGKAFSRETYEKTLAILKERRQAPRP